MYMYVRRLSCRKRILITLIPVSHMLFHLNLQVNKHSKSFFYIVVLLCYMEKLAMEHIHATESNFEKL